TGRSGHQHEPTRKVSEVHDDLRHTQLGNGFDFVWNKTKRCGQITAFMKGVHTKTSKRTKGKTEVEFFVLHQDLLLVLVKDRKNKRFYRRFVQRIKPGNRHQAAVNTQHRRQPHLQVKV